MSPSPIQAPSLATVFLPLGHEVRGCRYQWNSNPLSMQRLHRTNSGSALENVTLAVVQSWASTVSKAFRTPAPRHPRCDIRTTWLFYHGAWSKVGDRVSLEEVPNKTAKLEGKVVMSLTSFEKSREDLADTPDSDLEDPEPQAPPEGEGQDLRGEAKLKKPLVRSICSPIAQRTHSVQFAKRHRCWHRMRGRRGSSGTVTSKKFGDHATMDHIITRDLKDHGLDGERVALVIKDVYPKFRYIYPAEAKDTESCINSFKHFLKVEDKIGTIYSDNAPELIAAAIRLDWSRQELTSMITSPSLNVKSGQFSKVHAPILSRLVPV